MLNLDTHILIHALTGHVSAAERKLLAAEEWSISAIVLWEIAKLAQLRRIEIDLDDPALTRLLSGIQTWPITIDICRLIGDLDFKSDPADEIIAAPSITHNVRLLTRDQRIRELAIVPLAIS